MCPSIFLNCFLESFKREVCERTEISAVGENPEHLEWVNHVCKLGEEYADCAASLPAHD